MNDTMRAWLLIESHAADTRNQFLFDLAQFFQTALDEHAQNAADCATPHNDGDEICGVWAGCTKMALSCVLEYGIASRSERDR